MHVSTTLVNLIDTLLLLQISRGLLHSLLATLVMAPTLDFLVTFSNEFQEPFDLNDRYNSINWRSVHLVCLSFSSLNP